MVENAPALAILAPVRQRQAANLREWFDDLVRRYLGYTIAVRSDVVATAREKQVPWDHSLTGDVVLAR